MKEKDWKDQLKEAIEETIDRATDSSNVAVAANVGKKGAHTSVSSRQRVVQRDGKTTIEEQVERREA